MIYKFLMLSDEVDHFGREIAIDAEATFQALQEIIIESVGFKKGEICTFFICDDQWNRETEITPFEMDNDTQFDSWIMAETPLEELIEDEEQKLIFVFDNMTERSFFLELREIIEGVSLDQAKCTKSTGTPPQQFVNFDDFEKKSNLTIDENFYGDEEYDINELDTEGFDMGDKDISAYADEY